MSNYLLGFPNKKERDDFFIAIVVLLLFGFFMWYYVFGSKKPNIDPADLTSIAVVEKKADADNDGVFDEVDKCPALAGLASNGGCPSDKDNDGIYDSEDKCPTLSGVAANNGCPADSDGDGVYDINDNCPNINFASASGCPPDTDGDGVFDRDDKCPNEFGSVENNGCVKSAADKIFFENLKSSVQFGNGNATLTSASQNELDRVVRFLRKNKKTKIRVTGHTNSKGNPAKNMELSQRRANSCVAYLVSKGIVSTRLSSEGFGDQRPVASNETKEGLEKNRRVEFETY